ncbi:hypothetical protein QQP08_024421, partial [Theobroma cacao]
TVISFTKTSTSGINVAASDGFPSKVFFNEEQCALPSVLPTNNVLFRSCCINSCDERRPGFAADTDLLILSMVSTMCFGITTDAHVMILILRMLWNLIVHGLRSDL